MAAPGAPSGANGGGDAGDAAAQQGRQGDAQQNGQGQPDFAALSSQLEQLAGGQESLRQLLGGGDLNGDAGDDEAEIEGDGDFDPDDFDGEGMDFGDGDGEFDGYAGDGDPTESIAGEMADAFMDVTHQAMAPVAQALEQQQQEFERFKQDTEYRELVHELPELQDPEVAREVLHASHALAEAFGVPQLAGSAQFVRVAYLAGRALQQAQQEGSEPAPDPAHIEGGGGAIPGNSAGSAADQIIGARTKAGSSVLPFH